jgi:hypothetical protein
LDDRPATPVTAEIARTYEKMAFFDEDMEPWRIYDPKSTIHYIIQRVKAYVTDIATRNATPWLHRALYRSYTPSCIVSLFSTAVLYQNRTPKNTPMVMMALSTVVKELIEIENGRIIASPVDRLARCQAMFIYMVIRLLDGDVMLRAQGERDIPLLSAWLDDLSKVRENMGDLAQMGDSVVKQTPVEWEVSRTLLIRTRSNR